MIVGAMFFISGDPVLIFLFTKKIPFIIRRPIPNGGTEYWKIHDFSWIFMIFHDFFRVCSVCSVCVVCVVRL